MKRMIWILLALLPGLVSANEAEPSPFGRLEHISINLNKPVLTTATLDTGSDYSSLNVDTIETFELNYQNWVRFRVAGQSVEKPVVRRVDIKSKNGGGTKLRRFVTLEFCVRNIPMAADFVLLERNSGVAPVVLGMNVLEVLGPVDPSLRFTREPNCSQPEAIDLSQPISGF